MFFIVFVIFLILSTLKLLSILTNFQCIAKKCLIGKVAIVTGGNSGIGFEIVLDLASRGCKVIIADITNGEEIVTKIKEETGNQNVIWKYVDLGSLTSVREFAVEILKTESRLDLLINNAGTAGLEGFTEDGLQKVMQINYFGHFLLCHLLIGVLKKSQNPRIICISSALAFTHTLKTPKRINVEPELNIQMLDVMFQYGNSKLCLLIAMKLMALKLKKHGISCYSINPGAIYTPLIRTTVKNPTMCEFSRIVYFMLMRLFLFIFGKTTREGAQTTLHCALSKKVDGLSGKHFWNGLVFWEPPIAQNEAFCDQIWEESEQLVKLRHEEKIVE